MARRCGVGLGRSGIPLGLACLLLVASSCSTTQPIEAGDPELVVTLAHLASFGLELPEGYRDLESLKRERIFGGALTIEYEFESPDEGPPYVYSLAELHPSPGQACRSFSAGNLGIRLSGLDLLERPDLFQYGDKSRFALVQSEGRPVGNFFNMCRSRTAFLVVFVGLYFDDRDSWRELVAPRLRALEAFEAAHR